MIINPPQGDENGSMTGKELAFNWISAGGLESFAAMEKAAKLNPADARLGEWRKTQQVGAQLAGGRSNAKPASSKSGAANSFYRYRSYKYIARHWKEIDKAAHDYGIQRNILAALLMYESHWQHKQLLGPDLGDKASVKKEGENASVGLAQLEIYKVRMMLAKYNGKEYLDKKKRTIEELAAWMRKPENAIRAAAAWMKHLKENIKIHGRPLNDMEAAIGYCGCSGVVVYANRPPGEQIHARKFERWAENGWDPDELERGWNDKHVAINRRNDLH
ncbi:hypothetical protein FAF44_52300 [Nonomuraea sp. MG754425]|nr:hypothetical protein [Nonomuraea sp. MG754425]